MHLHQMLVFTITQKPNRIGSASKCPPIIKFVFNELGRVKNYHSFSDLLHFKEKLMLLALYLLVWNKE